MPLRDPKEVHELLKASGDVRLAYQTVDPETDELLIKQLPFTLNELVEAIQVTGNCAGRHLTYAEREGIIDP